MGGQGGGMWTAGDHTRLGCPALSSSASPSCTKDCSHAMTKHLTNTAEKRQGYFDSRLEGTEHRARKAQWQECEAAAHTRQWLTRRKQGDKHLCSLLPLLSIQLRTPARGSSWPPLRRVFQPQLTQSRIPSQMEVFLLDD